MRSDASDYARRIGLGEVETRTEEEREVCQVCIQASRETCGEVQACCWIEEARRKACAGRKGSRAQACSCEDPS
jgi:hypothetical protein